MAVASARRKEDDRDRGRDCQQSTDKCPEIAEIVRGLDGARVLTLMFEACHRARQQISFKVFFAPGHRRPQTPFHSLGALGGVIAFIPLVPRKDFLKAEVTPNFLGQEAEKKVADLYSTRRLITGIGMLKTKTRKPTPAARWPDP